MRQAQPPQLVPLGFEVGTGKPVSVPIGHMAVTGQTQQSGKTTAMEGLISRSGRRAVAFVTKRGERGFIEGRRIRPYFKERADWQFVEAILESAMRQKMRFERAWIVRAARGAHTLADVQRNVDQLQASSKRNMDQDIYMLLGEYLRLVVPLLETLPVVDTVDLRPGVNVMDLGSFPAELQALVIQSVLAWIYQHEQNVIAVIPEAWQFVPQGRGAPVRLAAIDLARKGAGLGDFMWLDSQDLAGVEKEVVRQASVWLLGVQREANEIKRTLAHIPAGIKKPKPGDIATLGIGQFWACWADAAIKTYVWPSWLREQDAQQVAQGKISIDKVIRDRMLNPPLPAPAPSAPLIERASMSKGIEAKLDMLIDLMHSQQRENAATPASAPTDKRRVIADALHTAAAVAGGESPAPAADVKWQQLGVTMEAAEEEMYQRFKVRLMQEAPALIKLMTFKPEIEVSVQRQTIQVDGKSLRGRIAKLLGEGFFDSAKSNRETVKELARTGTTQHDSRVLVEIKELIKLGFLYRTDGKRYQATADAKVNVVR